MVRTRHQPGVKRSGASAASARWPDAGAQRGAAWRWGLGFASLWFCLLAQSSWGREGRNCQGGLNGLGVGWVFFSVKLFRCVGGGWLLSSSVKGHILVSVSVGVNGS